MQVVYVLKSKKDGNLYIGCTSKLKTRIKMHNCGKVKSTKSRVPFILVYFEKFKNKYDAFRAEKFYKTVKGKKIIFQILGDRLTVGQRPLKP